MLSVVSLGQGPFEGTYLYSTTPPTSPDSIGFSTQFTYLKISGSQCYMDLISVRIRTSDTVFITRSRQNRYYRGTLSTFGNYLNLTLSEVYQDYFERIAPFNEKGIPVYQKEIKRYLALPQHQTLNIGEMIFKKIGENLTLVSENRTLN